MGGKGPLHHPYLDSGLELGIQLVCLVQPTRGTISSILPELMVKLRDLCHLHGITHSHVSIWARSRNSADARISSQIGLLRNDRDQ